MSDDQNITQNQDSAENSIPVNPQEPVANVPINTTDSEPSSMPPEALESPRNADIPVSLNNDNPENTPISTPSPEEAKPEELPAEGGKTEEILEPVQTSELQTAQIPVNEPLKPELVSAPTPAIIPPKNSIRELLEKAKNAIQFRKRKKLDKIMALFLKQPKITNDEIEKFLHVSDATATRYLSQLEKEGKIQQSGKTGKGVSYSRI